MQSDIDSILSSFGRSYGGSLLLVCSVVEREPESINVCRSACRSACHLSVLPKSISLSVCRTVGMFHRSLDLGSVNNLDLVNSVLDFPK